MSPPRAGAVVVGASAGALDALTALLSPLPEDFSLPIAVVVHLPADGKSLMADLLRAKCRIDVREADDKEPFLPGTAYLAPPDYHLLVEADGRLSLSSEEPVNYSRPSIDVLFESAADAYGQTLVGVVLTGANADGARGLGKVCAAGGTALVQRPETAYASAMPRAALEACPDARTADLAGLARLLVEIAGRA